MPCWLQLVRQAREQNIYTSVQKRDTPKNESIKAVRVGKIDENKRTYKYFWIAETKQQEWRGLGVEMEIIKKIEINK